MWGKRRVERDVRAAIDLLHEPDPRAVADGVRRVEALLPELFAVDPGATRDALDGLFRSVCRTLENDEPGTAAAVRLWKLLLIRIADGDRRDEALLFMHHGDQVFRVADRVGSARLVEVALGFGRAAAEYAGEPGDSLPALSRMLISEALSERYRHHARPDDLTEAIEAARTACRMVPDEPPNAAVMTAGALITALHLRYRTLADSTALDEAIRLSRAAVERAERRGVADTDRSGHLEALANGLLMAWELRGDAALIGEAAAACREAMARSDPSDAARQAKLLTALGRILATRDDDLDEAIATLHRAIDIDPAGSLAPAELSGLVLRREALANRRAEAEDTARAARTMAENTPPGQPFPSLDELPSFQPEPSQQALGDAVAHARAAVAATGPGVPGRPFTVFRLAFALAARGDVDGRDEAIDHLREVGETGLASVPQRVGAWQMAATLSAGAQRWSPAADFFRRAIALLPDLAPADLIRDDQEDLLRYVGTLGADGAAAALRAGADPADALRMIEDSRGVLIARALADEQEAPAPDATPPAWPAGPIVVLSDSGLGSHAFIVGGSGVRVVTLDLDPDDIVVRPEAFGLALEVVDDAEFESAHRFAAGRLIHTTLAWLWDAVAEPVLTAIGATAPSPAGGPRVWWMPTGAFGLLPLHAAGHHGSGAGDTVLDRVISSYTPTLRLLAAGRKAAPPAETGPALVVAIPDGRPPLPGALREADVVRGRFPGATVRIGAGRAEVLADLPNRSWVHFACHAVTDVSRPSRSHLLLGDGPLTVPDIAGVRLPGAHTAYLSACGTAQPAAVLTDEAIHIASAFHLAGYPQVVATLWPIGDDDAVAFARDFYDALDERGAAYAVHAATLLRRAASQGRSPLRWAAHVHSGP